MPTRRRLSAVRASDAIAGESSNLRPHRATRERERPFTGLIVNRSSGREDGGIKQPEVQTGLTHEKITRQSTHRCTDTESDYYCTPDGEASVGGSQANSEREKHSQHESGEVGQHQRRAAVYNPTRPL